MVILVYYCRASSRTKKSHRHSWIEMLGYLFDQDRHLRFDKLKTGEDLDSTIYPF